MNQVSLDAVGRSSMLFEAVSAIVHPLAAAINSNRNY